MRKNLSRGKTGDEWIMKQRPGGDGRKWYPSPCGKANSGKEWSFFSLILGILRKERKEDTMQI